MKIKEGYDFMIFRYSPYKKYDFITEHIKIINEQGSTWLLKFGKEIPSKTLDALKEKREGLILKAPKATGGDFYFCVVKNCFNGIDNSKMAYPPYYQKMLSDGFADQLSGSWFNIKSITKLNKDIGDHLRLKRNNRILSEVINETRTVIMHVYCDEDFIV